MVVLIAAGLVLVGNWVLVQWLPAAFGFAKPWPDMRRRLHPAPVEEPASGVAADEVRLGAALEELPRRGVRGQVSARIAHYGGSRNPARGVDIHAWRRRHIAAQMAALGCW